MALWELSGFVPVLAIMGAFYVWAHFRPSWKGRKPLKDKLLRGPGESLQIRIDDLTTKLVLPFITLVGIGMTLGTYTSRMMQLGGSQKLPFLIGAWSFFLIAMVLCGARILHVSRLLMDYRLGFSGERAVGEELNKLMLDSCLVYHDLVVENWNIDHVVIAPSGVFAVETKTYRKKAKNGEDFFKVRFDGKVLRFPSWTERKPLEQAKRNAGWLSDTLSKALAEPISVQPIVTLPGWLIIREGKGDVFVLNHREFRQCILKKGPALLSEKQMQQIAYQIEQRCRNVAF
jgi:hypothetical protein